MATSKDYYGKGVLDSMIGNQVLIDEINGLQEACADWRYNVTYNMIMGDSQPLFSASHTHPKPWATATKLGDAPMLGVPKFHSLNEPKRYWSLMDTKLFSSMEMRPGQLVFSSTSSS